MKIEVLFLFQKVVFFLKKLNFKVFIQRNGFHHSVLFSFVVLGIEPRVLHVLGKLAQLMTCTINPEMVGSVLWIVHS